MKFSIITPSFNQGRFLTDCLQSVRKQMTGGTFELEHLVIDACSTDETVAILQEWKDRDGNLPGYHFDFVSEPDKGQTDAINKGFRRATGDWMMWLNADDYLTEGALAKVEALARSNDRADVIYGDCIFVDEAGKALREKREFDFDFGMLLFYGCFIPSTSSFYRRRIIDTGHLLDDSYRVVMDFEYYVRLAREGFRFQYLPELLACFRWHGSNISAVHVTRRREERLRVQREHLKLSKREWLGSEPVLNFLYRVYQCKRALLRVLLAGSPR